MKVTQIPIVAFATMLFAVQALKAADCTQAGNLVSNCGFDSDLSGWEVSAADSSAHIPDDGAFALGSVEIDRDDGIEAVEVFSTCLAVSPATQCTLGVAHRLVAGPFAQRCFLDVWEFDDSACTDFLESTSFPFTPVPTWFERFDRQLVIASTESAYLRLVCAYSKNDFVIRLDDFMFGENLFSPVIFNDGFESEFTDVWSGVLP